MESQFRMPKYVALKREGKKETFRMLFRQTATNFSFCQVIFCVFFSTFSFSAVFLRNASDYDFFLT